MTQARDRRQVGVLLGKRPDLLRALFDIAEIEVVAVARPARGRRPAARRGTR